MKDKNLLLIVDGIINLALGILMLFFPTQLTITFELPKAENNFYITILGVVLFGIGIALLLEYFSNKLNVHGLGIAGAIVINLCGSGSLIAWLLFGNLDLPIGGSILLWSIALIVLGVAIIEIFSRSWKEYERRNPKSLLANIPVHSPSGITLSFKDSLRRRVWGQS